MIPSNLRVPVTAVTFDSSRAEQGPSLLSYTVLLVAQKTAAGTATANTVVRVLNADQVAQLCGRGSQAHRMARAYFANNRSTETYLGVLADPQSGVAATGTVTISGTATASGILNLYVGGARVQVGVGAGDSASTVATALAALMPATSDLAVTGTATAGAVALTARNKGAAGNDLDVRLNYQDGEVTPPGLTVAVTPMASGAGNPLLTDLIAAMGDKWFQVIAHPYTDATSLTALEAEMVDRAGPLRMIDGVALTSAAGSHATLSTLGATRNCPYSVICSQPGAGAVTPPDEFAAAVAGVLALYAAEDPARPLQTLPVAGVLAPAEADLFTLLERNLLLYNGVSTTCPRVGGGVALEGAVTTYRRNAAGLADTAYLQVTTILTLLYLRYSFRARWAKYARHKLADDSARARPGQPVMTPSLAKAETILWFRDMEGLGLVENFAQFKRDLEVSRDPADRNRLNFTLPPDLINQLVVSAVTMQFRL